MIKRKRFQKSEERSQSLNDRDDHDFSRKLAISDATRFLLIVTSGFLKYRLRFSLRYSM